MPLWHEGCMCHLLSPPPAWMPSCLPLNSAKRSQTKATVCIWLYLLQNVKLFNRNCNISILPPSKAERLVQSSQKCIRKKKAATNGLKMEVPLGWQRVLQGESPPEFLHILLCHLWICFPCIHLHENVSARVEILWLMDGTCAMCQNLPSLPM